MLARTTLAPLALGGLVTLGFMIRAGEPSSASWWVAFVPFAGWALLPYAAVGWALRQRPSTSASDGLLLVTATTIAIASAFLLYDAFVVHPDPQSGLVLVVLPLWQLVAVGPLVGLARWLGRRGAEA